MPAYPSKEKPTGIHASGSQSPHVVSLSRDTLCMGIASVGPADFLSRRSSCQAAEANMDARDDLGNKKARKIGLLAN